MTEDFEQVDIQARDAAFDRVQAYVIPELTTHDLLTPGIHLHVLCQCMNALWFSCQVEGLSFEEDKSIVPMMLEKSIRPRNKRSGTFYGALVFKDGHVINQAGLVGWDAINRQSGFSPAPVHEDAAAYARVAALKGIVAVEMMTRQVDSVAPSLIARIVDTVLSHVAADQLDSATTLGANTRQGLGRL